MVVTLKGRAAEDISAPSCEACEFFVAVGLDTATGRHLSRCGGHEASLRIPGAADP